MPISAVPPSPAQATTWVCWFFRALSAALTPDAAPAVDSAQGGELIARLAGAVGRASLRQWLRQATARMEGSLLVLEVPADQAHVADQLRRKSSRAALLEAAREGLSVPVQELEVSLRTEKQEGRPAVQEPPPATAPGKREGAQVGGYHPLLKVAPAVRTLLQVFDGAIVGEEEPTGDGRAGKDERRLEAT